MFKFTTTTLKISDCMSMLELSIFVGIGLRDAKYRRHFCPNILPTELSKAFFCSWFLREVIVIGGGVEDTRLEAKAKNRPSRGQGQECSRPKTRDTSASALQKKRSSEKFFRRSPKKKVFRKNFQAISRKNHFAKNFSGALQTFNNSKNSVFLEPRTGQFSRT